jgi:hypothetical protein
MYIKIWVLIFVPALLLGACREKNENPDFKGIVVDVNKEYPQKELSRLQDIADVEYVPLEINDTFLLNCRNVDYLDDEIIVTHNGDYYSESDGNIFVFDRTGKPLKRINRLGEGPEEYNNRISSIVYDRENQELYVCDGHKQKIFVYDLTGGYKRELQVFEKDKAYIKSSYNFNKDYLLCFVGLISETRSKRKESFMIISKQTGEIVKEIITYDYEERLSARITKRDDKLNSESSLVYHTCEQAIKSEDGFLLNHTASDTIYTLHPDLSISPAIAQTPTLKDLVPAVFLSAGKETNRYIFMNVLVKNFDFNTPPSKWYELVYDKNTHDIFEQNFYNGDYTHKMGIWMRGNGASIHLNQYVELIQADELAESYEKGEVQGKLKEIASKIDMEDNPIVMIVTFK